MSVCRPEFSQPRFHEALAGRLGVCRSRLRVLGVDPLDNAVLLHIEEGDQPAGYSSTQATAHHTPHTTRARTRTHTRTHARTSPPDTCPLRRPHTHAMKASLDLTACIDNALSSFS